MLLDAHIHLTDQEYSPYLESIVLSMRAMKIAACSVTVDIATTRRSLSLFGPRTSDCIKQFVGIHPEAAAKEDLDEFTRIFNDNKAEIDGVGEIGLDKTYVERGVPYEKQTRTFDAMLSLAEKSGKPVSIHSRKSLDDILKILPSFRIKGCLVHWFAGSKKQLSVAMDLGCYASYGPVLVYSQEKKVLLGLTRRDKILIETDGPVKYAKCFTGYPALSTSFLTTVARTVGDTLGLSYADTVVLLERNANSYMNA